MGTATGTMNFFRSLGGAIIVAGFGAIVMGSLPADKAANVTMDTLAPALAAGGSDIGTVFRWVFGAAAVGILLTLYSLAVMEERPLRTMVGAAPVAVE
jgi:hypothetical protein